MLFQRTGERHATSHGDVATFARARLVANS
jgi:hypothetical protein